MHRILFYSLIAVLLATTEGALHALTPTYDKLIVFGDSYCDVGNIFALTGGAEPAAPYYNGRFSNGPIWLDHVAGFLGVPLKASALGGTDYAFGGAWVTEGKSFTGVPSVVEQVELYLSQHGGKADPNALYILEGGGNDILETTSHSPETLGLHIAEGLAYSELLLREAGARHLIIPDLFNVALLPAAAGNTTFAAKAIPVSHPVGIIASPDGKTIYVASSGFEVAFISVKSQTVVANVSLAATAYAVAVSPDGKWLYAACDHPSKGYVISVENQSVVADFTIGSGPRNVIVSPDGKTVYVASFDSQSLYVIDAETYSVEHKKVLGALDGIAFSATAKPLIENYKFKTLDYPGAAKTEVHQINENGYAVGFYVDKATVQHGFLYHRG